MNKSARKVQHPSEKDYMRMVHMKLKTGAFNQIRGFLSCRLQPRTILTGTTNSMVYGTRKFNATFTRALQ